jgi:hypothetical protein
MPFNRDVHRTQYLEKSMQEHGWIDAYPMHVQKNGGDHLLIKAGHHRFCAARKLGIPVKYVICADEATIHELEKATNRWTIQDYLDSHIRQNRKDYMRVREYCDATGISVGMAVALLSGHTAHPGAEVLNAFRDGHFKIKPTTNALIVKELCRQAHKCKLRFYNNYLFVQALSRIAWVKELDVERMKSKFALFSDFMEKKANLEQYLAMLEDIYNRQSRTKIPLAFLATQASKERDPIKH